jgi:hypothetical protein
LQLERFLEQRRALKKRTTRTYPNQGCQMVYFQTKKTILGKIWRALEWKLLFYFMTSWNILLPFGII